MHALRFPSLFIIRLTMNIIDRKLYVLMKTEGKRIVLHRRGKILKD
jgi:hypothetical protein